VNERDPTAHSGTTRDEIQPFAIGPNISGAPGSFGRPELMSIRRRHEILREIALGAQRFSHL
jgi:hypothetical protein